MIILTVELIRISHMWICEIWMSINPNNPQVWIDSPHTTDSSSSYRMISSHCKQQIFCLFFSYLGNLTTESSEKRSQQIQISGGKLNLWVHSFFFFKERYVTIVNNLSIEVFLKMEKSIDISEQLWSLLHASDGLSLADGSSEIGYFFYDGCSGLGLHFSLVLEGTLIFIIFIL